MTGQVEVSCIMPTRGRRAWVPLAVRCWMEQTLATFARELLVIDDGPEPCGDLLPTSERVRYVHLAGHHSIGAKLNLGCRMARGDLMAAWADDDYHAPQRLALQADAMARAPGVGVCGCDSILYWAPGWPEQLWRYENVPGRRTNAYVTGGTMLWRRSFWEERPYDETPAAGEDTRWLQGRRQGLLLGTLPNDFYVATIHSGNTGLKDRAMMLGSSQWQRLAGHVLDAAPVWWVAGALAAMTLCTVEKSGFFGKTGLREERYGDAG